MIVQVTQPGKGLTPRALLRHLCLAPKAIAHVCRTPILFTKSFQRKLHHLLVGCATTACTAVLAPVEIEEQNQEGNHVEEEQFAEELRVWRPVVAVCGLQARSITHEQAVLRQTSRQDLLPYLAVEWLWSGSGLDVEGTSSCDILTWTIMVTNWNIWNWVR